MTIQITDSIRTFFDISNGADAAGIEQCFTPDAVVTDEHRQHRGHEAIQRWKQDAREKFDYTVEPLSASQQGTQITVEANVVGNFPGSPVQLTHTFELQDDKIRSLEIN